MTEKQRRFVELYMGEAAGNATAAYESAYGCSEAAARSGSSRLLTNANILAEIESRQNEDPRIANREDRQRFWSEVMNSTEGDMTHRLRASELLGKSGGDFVQKHEHSGPGGSPLTVTFNQVNDRG